MDSSAAFETTFFPNKTVLGYQHPKFAEGSGNPLHSAEYLSLFHVFHTAAEFEGLLTSTELAARDGRAFFASVYGDVDGTEPRRIIDTRGERCDAM